MVAKSKKLIVHPIAALFPMLSDEELEELANDIATNGQIHPAVLDQEGQLVDGINRVKACEIAGVECQFETLENGIDPTTYILAANINRRHLSKGQRAIAVAMIYPEPQQRGKKSRVLDNLEGNRKGWIDRLSQARAVFRFNQELAKEVLNGNERLDSAYRRSQMFGDEESTRKTKLRELKKERPDLAEAVEEETMTLEEAENKADADEEAARQLRWSTTTNLLNALDLIDTDPKFAADIAASYDPEVAKQSGKKVTRTRLEQAAAYFTALATQWK